MQWYGYGEDENRSVYVSSIDLTLVRLIQNSWEPENNLQKGCEKLLESFWCDVGFDNKDYHVGHVVHAKKSWIGQLTRSTPFYLVLLDIIYRKGEAALSFRIWQGRSKSKRPRKKEIEG